MRSLDTTRVSGPSTEISLRQSHGVELRCHSRSTFRCFSSYRHMRSSKPAEVERTKRQEVPVRQNEIGKNFNGIKYRFTPPHYTCAAALVQWDKVQAHAAALLMCGGLACGCSAHVIARRRDPSKPIDIQLTDTPEEARGANAGTDFQGSHASPDRHTIARKCA